MQLLQTKNHASSLEPVFQFWNEKDSFEVSAYGIAIINSVSGTISRANDAYCALLGRSIVRVVGQTWMRFTHLDDVARDV